VSTERCDILIFGPHPDDEALGCAGLIHDAIKKKQKVKIIIVTNGESSVEGTEWFYGHKAKKEDFIDIGYVRQKESISAMNVLGLKKEDIIFLGYPNDGLLDIIYSDKYSIEKPFKSEYTGFDSVSFKDSYNIGAPFCKDSINNDIRIILKEYTPKNIYVTHPLDSHNDHKACGRFVNDISKQFDTTSNILSYMIAKSKIPSKKQRLIYKAKGQLKEKYLDESTRKIKEECIHQYKSQSFLFDEIAFHNEVERFYKI
jgi:LmbE family N-acetylglucosaminyl deacetylase